MTQYQTIDAGTRRVQVSVAGSADQPDRHDADLSCPTSHIRLWRSGQSPTPRGIILNDTLIVDPGAGNFNAAGDQRREQQRRQSMSTSRRPAKTSTRSRRASPASVYGTTSLFVNLPVGQSRDSRSRAANSKQVIFDAPAQTFCRARARPVRRLFARQQYAGQCRPAQHRRRRHWIDRQQLCSRSFKVDQRLIGAVRR